MEELTENPNIGAPEAQVNDESQDETRSREKYLLLARVAYEESETFLEAGQRTQWRRNYSIAQSEHPDGSKYLKKSFEHRSKVFRGKTEASLRKNEAAFAVAMFTNRDVVSITAENPDDEAQVEAAKAINKLANYRLDKSIKWFMTSVGAYHDAMIVGDVVSEQYWDYDKTEDGEVITDQPAIELFPLEHCHVSPNADWRDPVNSSPYFIVEFPMFLGDIKERMGIDWIEYEDNQIQTAQITYKHNSVKQARDGEDQIAASDQTSSIAEFDTIYVHKNFIRKDGQDLFYYTLGTVLLLSEPVPVKEAYPHIKKNKRPFVWGTATIEPHKLYRRSLVDRVASTQGQSNEIANQRFDNVRQVLNKRKFVTRGMGVDYSTLLKSVPGSIILEDQKDSVREEQTSDVTGSSYQEQHMINADFDELSGTFSNASISTNRQMNDTVGGMQLLKGNSNALEEYQMKVFVLTWVTEVIEQLVEMIQFYEDDEVIQSVTSTEVTHEDIQSEVDVAISVGFGATDPQLKVNNIMAALQSLTAIMPEEMQNLDGEKIFKELFGAMGFGDGDKFRKKQEGQDPQVEQLMQHIQELTQYIESEQFKIQGKAQADIAVEEVKAENRMDELLVKLKAERQGNMTGLALKHSSDSKESARKSGVDSGKLNLDFLKETNRRVAIDTDRRELDYKMRTGKPGI